MSTPTTADVLRRAKALIADPEDWCQGYREGWDGDRWRRCAVGALGAAKADLGLLCFNAPNRALCDAMPKTYYAVAEFNDASTHADVMALYDRAIAAAEEKTCQDQ